MSRIGTFLKRHSLWAGFLAVLAPLLVLLALQYTWLDRLKRLSAIAHQATLDNYLEAVGTEVQYAYRAAAERGLNLPATYFTQGRLAEVASWWEKKPVEGARRLFLVDYTKEPFGQYRVYNPERRVLESPLASDESLAIIVACNPWQLLSYRKRIVHAVGLNADERNPEFRIILNPITDDMFRVVGVAGMILDEEHFTRAVLPAAVTKALPTFFPGAARGDLVVTVRDGSGRIVLKTGDDAGKGPAATAHFPFVFTDWTLSLHNPRTTPEQWARAGFVFNLTLSAMLALVLMGGIALALKVADRAMRLSAMKSDFVSNVSHELRTPLASIRVFAELLRLGKAATPDKAREYGAYIEAESRRLSRLIDNILDFSRIESGRKTYRFERADLWEVVAGTVRGFEMHLKDSGFRIALEPPDGPLPPVVFDPDAIGQAVHNLLDNAVKYSGDSKEIAVRVAREGEALVIEVRDRGIGIPAAEQAKIFERFHRVGTGLVHEVKGSGLGLSIVQHIVEVHRGRVAVESEPGRGSTFRIRLPLESGPQPG
jgi:signal transduction histidine kinase